MRTILPALAIVVTATCAFAATPPESVWRPMARACAAATDEHGGFWPVWAKCAIQNTWPGVVPEQTIHRCIQIVGAQRQRTHACNNCGDPVKSVIACAVRE